MKSTLKIELEEKGDINIILEDKNLIIPQNKVFALYRLLTEIVKKQEEKGLLVDSFGKKVKL